ncbi:MAG: prephenate dehydrogenase/arogenate dehydrogenase family protein [Candidatus Omnitrophica bacterium]|nr:prephenate dehydrogenase/arogenate dehydrogenase family protein [Candidatus Omnitrophota bacterium]
MQIFKKVAVIGIGLIGGSLALDIKKKKLSQEVVGVSRHKETISLALKIKAIDKGSLSLNIIRGADLIIIATPVDTIIGLEKEILRYAGRDCIVTDVASTKEVISKSLGGIFPNYIGSHPLAGSEKRGIMSASCGIFKGSLCILTLGKKFSLESLKKIRKMWRVLGAKVIILDPKEHDKALGFASHLPHIIAFSLMKSIPLNTLRFSARGLKDTTRIAASDPSLWKGIFLSNRRNILKAIDSFQGNLNKIKSAIKTNDAKALEKILLKSQKIRELLK